MDGVLFNLLAREVVDSFVFRYREQESIVEPILEPDSQIEIWNQNGIRRRGRQTDFGWQKFSHFISRYRYTPKLYVEKYPTLKTIATGSTCPLSRAEPYLLLPPPPHHARLPSHGVSPSKKGHHVAFDPNRCCGSAGVLSRDHQGNVLAAAARWPFDDVPDTLTVEAMAAKEGLELASENSYDRVILEVDCKGLKNLLDDGSSSFLDWRHQFRYHRDRQEFQRISM